MKPGLLQTILIAALLAGCAPASTSTPDTAATAMSMALTMVAQTQAAQPTLTAIPTETPAPPPTSTPTQVLMAVPSPTSTTSVSASDCNHPLGSWAGPSTTFILDNDTKENIVLSLSVVTKEGECGYMGWSYKKSMSVTVPFGCYYAFAYVGNKKTVSGSFCANSGNWSIVVKDDRIVAQGSCYSAGSGC
jgi:hypothetical protein